MAICVKDLTPELKEKFNSLESAVGRDAALTLLVIALICLKIQSLNKLTM